MPPRPPHTAPCEPPPMFRQKCSISTLCFLFRSATARKKSATVSRSAVCTAVATYFLAEPAASRFRFKMLSVKPLRLPWSFADGADLGLGAVSGGVSVDCHPYLRPFRRSLRQRLLSTSPCQWPRPSPGRQGFRWRLPAQPRPWFQGSLRQDDGSEGFPRAV